MFQIVCHGFLGWNGEHIDYNIVPIDDLNKISETVYWRRKIQYESDGVHIEPLERSVEGRSVAPALVLQRRNASRRFSHKRRVPVSSNSGGDLDLIYYFWYHSNCTIKWKKKKKFLCRGNDICVLYLESAPTRLFLVVSLCRKPENKEHVFVSKQIQFLLPSIFI